MLTDLQLRFRACFFLLFLTSLVLFSFSQKAAAGTWTQTGGPEGAIIREEIVISPTYATDKTLFTYTAGGRLFKSTDGGSTWALIDIATTHLVISPEYSSDRTLYSVCGGVCKTTDGGVTWERLNVLTGYGYVRLGISPAFGVDRTLLAATNIAVMRSTDAGKTWNTTNLLYYSGGSTVRNFAFSPSFSSDHTVFASWRNGAVYKSTDGGATWTGTTVSAGSVVSSVKLSPAFPSDGTVFATTNAGVFKSVDAGSSWYPVNAGISTAIVSNLGSPLTSAQSLAVSPSYATDQTLFLAARIASYKSTDGGASWTPVDLGLVNFNVEAFTFSPDFTSDNTVFAATAKGVSRSTDGGNSWALANTNLKGWNINSLSVSPSYSTDKTVFACTYGGLWKTVNGGNSWIEASSGIPSGSVFKKVVLSPSYDSDRTAFVVLYETVFGYLSTPNARVYKTVDGGASWSVIDTGAFSVSANGSSSINISPAFNTDQTLFLTANDGILKSTNGGASWTRSIIYPPQSGWNLVISPNYASDQTLFIYGPGGGIKKSTDGGISWTPINSGLPDNWSNYLIISPSYESDQTLYVLNTPGIYKSTDGGASWGLTATNPTGVYFTALAISPSYSLDHEIYGGAAGSYASNPLWKTNDDGVTWTRIPTGLVDRIDAIAFSPNYRCDGAVFVGTQNSSVWMFTETVAPCMPFLRSISGKVMKGGAGLAGVTVTLAGAAAASTVTAPDGTFVFTGLADGGYTVTPTLNAFSFSPSSAPVTVSGADVVGVDFSTADPGGIVMAWGNNWLGQLGDGTQASKNSPVRAGGLTGIIAIDAGSSHSLALKNDGTVWAWGDNGSGQLGDGTWTDRTTPVQVVGLADVVAISAGGNHSLALKQDGTVWAWGLNTNGQLGDGTITNGLTPVQVSGPAGFVAIKGGYIHSLALKGDGSVWAWGNNGYGQLGDGTTVQRRTPVQVSGLTGMVAIERGYYHSIALKSDGTAWAWGYNGYGQLGDGTITQRNTPVQVSGLTGIAAISGGPRSLHSAAVKNDGTAWAWGYNGYGQLGDGTITQRNMPVQVNGITGVSAVSEGYYYSLAIKSDGTAWAWGHNLYGQLGNGTSTMTQTLTPVNVIGLVGVSAIAGGSYHSIAIIAAPLAQTCFLSVGQGLGGVSLNAFEDAYNRAGGYAVLGCPVPRTAGAPPVEATLSSGASGAIGLVQWFEKGHIHLKNGDAVAYASIGKIDTAYIDMGGTASQLGFPASDQFVTADGQARQDFEGGYIEIGIDGTIHTFFNIQPTLVKLNDSSANQVYYISGALKRHIPDPETFEILGFDWASIQNITPAEMGGFTAGASVPVLRTGASRDGSLIRRSSGNTIKVYLIENGLARHVPDPDTLYMLGRRFDEVIDLDGEFFDRIPKGAALLSSVDESFVSYLGTMGQAIAGGVNTATGNYTHRKTDLSILGRRIPFVFSRTYNALAPYNPNVSSLGERYPLGPGWTHSYNVSATEMSKDGARSFVRIKWGDGSEEFFRWNGTAYAPANGSHSSLSVNGTTELVLLTQKQVKYVFGIIKSDTFDSQDASGAPTTLRTAYYRLASISDTRDGGGEVKLTHEFISGIPSGNLLSVTDTVGRMISFAYDGSGRLIGLTDPVRRTVEFTYDGDGNLFTAKDLKGGITTYSYKKDKVVGMATPLIDSITDPRGNPYVQNSYNYSDGITRMVASPDYRKASSVTRAGVTATFNFDGAAAVVSNPLTAATYAHSANRLTGINDARGNIAIGYDAVNILDPSSITDRRGNATAFTYDGSGNILTATDALGKKTNFLYDARNNPISRTDALGRVTSYSYDAVGNLVAITTPDSTTSVTYNAYGQPAAVTDANGNTTNFVYDLQGNIIELNEPLGRTTKFTYDGVGRKTTETDANGNTTSYTYDNNDNVLTVTNALGKTAAYQYDPNDNLVSVIDENGNATIHTYDARNRLIKTADPLGNTTSYSYDVVGRLSSVKDENNRTTSYVYDEAGNVTAVTGADGKSVVYAYDADGNRVSMKDPDNRTVSYAYNAVNRILSRTESYGAYSFTYDDVGNMLSMKDAKNIVTNYSYDQMNRLKTVTYPDSSSVTFTYDKNGNRTEMVDSLGRSTYQYDALNRVISYTDVYNMTVGYGYDRNNNRISMTYPGGKAVAYGFDALNSLSTVTDWMGRTTAYTYDAASRLTNMSYPNGSKSVYAYDNANRLTGLANSKSTSAIISSYVYSLDAAGNQTSVAQEEPLVPVVSSQNLSYAYDAENRVTSVAGTSYVHDANGNLTSRGSDSFQYDYRDKLTSSTVSGMTTHYRYDGEGNRLARINGGVTRRYVLDISGGLPEVIAETDGGGNITAYYVYGLGLLSRVLPDGAASYYHFDSRGSTVALTDAGQTITDAYAYDPFGKVLNSFGSTPNPFRFVGQHGLMDDGNGLTYVRARYYSPELGRFITKDPLVDNESDSQSLNRYSYSLNNPVGMVDVSGFSPVDYLGDYYIEDELCFIVCRKQKTIYTARDIYERITWNLGLGFGIRKSEGMDYGKKDEGRLVTFDASADAGILGVGVDTEGSVDFTTPFLRGGVGFGGKDAHIEFSLGITFKVSVGKYSITRKVNEQTNKLRWKGNVASVVRKSGTVFGSFLYETFFPKPAL